MKRTNPLLDITTESDDDGETCSHFIAYVEMIGAMHRGYEKAHGDDDCCRESFANALVFLLVRLYECPRVSP